jgi:hypothetical protein
MHKDSYTSFFISSLNLWLDKLAQRLLSLAALAEAVERGGRGFHLVKSQERSPRPNLVAAVHGHFRPQVALEYPALDDTRMKPHPTRAPDGKSQSIGAMFATVALLLQGVANAQNAHFVGTPKASFMEGHSLPHD